MADKVKHEPLFHVVKRGDMPAKKAWLIRIITIVFAFLVVGVLTTILSSAGFFDVYREMFKGVFGGFFNTGSTKMIMQYLNKVTKLLILAIAVTPAFKMKFWNCGAEGQALMGAFAAYFCTATFGKTMPNGLLIVVIIVTSIFAGALWGVIPAIFKAIFNTNETLFTLMMNYIATQLVAYYVCVVSNGNSTAMRMDYGTLPEYISLIVVAVIMVIMFIYFRYSKQGYEISVVGESQNTARYIGINVKKVIIRTMVISGAICGIAGMLLVSGESHNLNKEIVGGQGFTAILISWLGQFNPFIMAAMTAVVLFIDVGVERVANIVKLSSSPADIMIGIAILMLVACEFFINYSIKFRHNQKED